MESVRIREVLVPALKESFPTRPFDRGELPNCIARFAAEHPAVGDVEITDDDTEATVYIGNITHRHFNPYDPSLSPLDLARTVSGEVIQFLTDLFADRVLLWAAPGGGQSGCQYPFDGAVPTERPSDSNLFVWSGPLAQTAGWKRGQAR